MSYSDYLRYYQRKKDVGTIGGYVAAMRWEYANVTEAIVYKNDTTERSLYPGVYGEPWEMPYVRHSDGQKEFVHLGNWLVYPVLMRGTKIVEPFGNKPTVHSDAEFRATFVPVTPEEPNMNILRKSLLEHIDEYIVSSRNKYEPEAMTPFLSQRLTITREEITSAKQYLDKLEHVVKVRDIIKGELPE